LKDPAERTASIAKAKAEFLDAARTCPYIGTFDEVFLVGPKKEQAVLFKFRDAASGKQPISAAIRAFLMKHWRSAWTDDIYDNKPPQVTLVGFQPEWFVTLLGLECSMPPIDNPMPLGFWLRRESYFDIGEALLPATYAGRVTPVDALKARRPRDKDDAVKWDKIVANWTGPGKDPMQDTKIAAELSTQLGVVRA